MSSKINDNSSSDAMEVDEVTPLSAAAPKGKEDMCESNENVFVQSQRPLIDEEHYKKTGTIDKSNNLGMHVGGEILYHEENFNKRFVVSKTVLKEAEYFKNIIENDPDVQEIKLPFITENEGIENNVTPSKNPNKKEQHYFIGRWAANNIWFVKQLLKMFVGMRVIEINIVNDMESLKKTNEEDISIIDANESILIGIFHQRNDTTSSTSIGKMLLKIMSN